MEVERGQVGHDFDLHQMRKLQTAYALRLSRILAVEERSLQFHLCLFSFGDINLNDMMFVIVVPHNTLYRFYARR